jgi:hypothetical protein
MDLTIDQAELFPAFPTIAATARKRSPLRVMMDAVERHGPLVPRAFIHVALDMSKQRVHQLVHEGKLATIDVCGRDFVPLASLDVFLSDERKAGRPAKDTSDMSLRQLWRHAHSKK